MNYWNEESTAHRLIKSFSQFRKLDWQQDPINRYKKSEIQVLFCIKQGSDNKVMSVSDISKFLHVTSPTVTQIINSLEENGLVDRQINKEDRRSINVTLTEEGEKVTEQAADKFFSSINGLIDHLGEEESEQLAHLLNKVFHYYKDVHNR